MKTVDATAIPSARSAIATEDNSTLLAGRLPVKQLICASRHSRVSQSLSLAQCDNDQGDNDRGRMTSLVLDRWTELCQLFRYGYSKCGTTRIQSAQLWLTIHAKIKWTNEWRKYCVHLMCECTVHVCFCAVLFCFQIRLRHLCDSLILGAEYKYPY